MFLLAKNCFTNNELWAGALFWCKIHPFLQIPVVSFSHVHTISSRLQCNTADLPSGHWAPTLPSQYLGYQRKQLCVDGLDDHHLSRFLCLPKIICAIQTCVHETRNLHRKPQSIIEKFPSRISSVSLLQSDIFRPRIRTRLYLKIRPLVLSKAIEISVTL